MLIQEILHKEQIAEPQAAQPTAPKYQNYIYNLHHIYSPVSQSKFSNIRTSKYMKLGLTYDIVKSFFNEYLFQEMTHDTYNDFITRVQVKGNVFLRSASLILFGNIINSNNFDFLDHILHMNLNEAKRDTHDGKRYRFLGEEEKYTGILEALKGVVGRISPEGVALEDKDDLFSNLNDVTGNQQGIPVFLKDHLSDNLKRVLYQQNNPNKQQSAIDVNPQQSRKIFEKLLLQLGNKSNCSGFVDKNHFKINTTIEVVFGLVIMYYLSKIKPIKEDDITKADKSSISTAAYQDKEQ